MSILRLSLASLLLVGVVNAGVAQRARPVSIPLWPSDAPGASGTDSTDVPAVSVYLAPHPDARHAAILICPGGGYTSLADYEGHDIAVWLNSIGVTAIVLRYRLGPTYHYPIPMLDAARAMRWIRAHAGALKADPSRIGIMGFSAGGHLAAYTSTHFDYGEWRALDPVERAASRPDFSVLIYPVITMNRAFTHAGSRRALLGDTPDDSDVLRTSNETQVSAVTPPAFIVHTEDDNVVPVANAIAYADAMRRAGRPVELHMFPHGPHGFGLAADNPSLAVWTVLLTRWLRGIGALSS